MGMTRHSFRFCANTCNEEKTSSTIDVQLAWLLKDTNPSAHLEGLSDGERLVQFGIDLAATQEKLQRNRWALKQFSTRRRPKIFASGLSHFDSFGTHQFKRDLERVSQPHGPTRTIVLSEGTPWEFSANNMYRPGTTPVFAGAVTEYPEFDPANASSRKC
jgi:hypothetical protein